MPFLALEEVHGPSTMGAQGSAFGKDPFAARHELSVTHKTDVPLGAMDMTVPIERTGIARGTDNVHLVGQIHKNKLLIRGNLPGPVAPLRQRNSPTFLTENMGR